MTELLTTSRIRRLLRPLRNKCNSLAALPSSQTAARLTYSKQSSKWDLDCRPPLLLLCPPAGSKKLTLDKRSSDEFERSRRIYAVCDAFKNIIHVAYGLLYDQRVPSLAVVCTLIIGENMPVTNADGTLLDSGQASVNENDLDVDGIYEAVPPHYRRFLIVPHALSIILSICNRHYTLVAVLLDHCLSFGLLHESTRLLNIILEQAFVASNPSHPPPATHPAHTDYLLDLHAKWIAGNKPPGVPSDSLLFTTSAFCRVMLDTLSQSSSSHSLWTSKVLDRLLHVVKIADLDSYLAIIHTLSRSFSETSGSAPDTVRDDIQSVILRSKLSELMSDLFDLLFTHGDLHSSLQTPSRIHAATDILYECHTAGLHCLRMSTPGLPVDLSDMIITFTTHIYVAFRNTTGNSDRLLAMLDDSSPVPSTFHKLMEYFSRIREKQAFDDFMKTFLSQLKIYSSALRSEKLLRLDASLWACALHHFEASISSSQKGSSTLATGYKQQLMEAVEAAEHRCFGGYMDSSPIVSLSISPNRAKPAKRGRPSGYWEWEDMVESWIRKTPVHKKQKIDNGHLQNHSRLRGTVISKVAPGSTSPFTPLSTCRQRLPTLSPTSSQSSESDGSDYQDGSDKTRSSSPQPVVRRSRLIKRRSSNFFSLLADAQMNRIVLHPKPHPEPKLPSSFIPEKLVQPHRSQEFNQALGNREQKPETNCRKVVPPTTPRSRTLLYSDDSLDLFAYATSSPARC